MMSELFDEEKLYEAYIRSLKREAFEQNFEQGRVEERRELAEKMRAKGYSEQEIAELLS